MKKLFLKEKVASKTPFKIEVRKNEQYVLRSRRASKKQPFCDSLHKGSKFLSIVFKAPRRHQ